MLAPQLPCRSTESAQASVRTNQQINNHRLPVEDYFSSHASSIGLSFNAELKLALAFLAHLELHLGIIMPWHGLWHLASSSFYFVGRYQSPAYVYECTIVPISRVVATYLLRSYYYEQKIFNIPE